MIAFDIPSTLKYLFLTFSDVFLSESPKVPGLKFDRDTSSFGTNPISQEMMVGSRYVGTLFNSLISTCIFSTLTLYSFYGIDEENLFNNQDIFYLLMISFILVTFVLIEHCPPTPPLSQHFAPSETEVSVEVGLGEG